MYKECFQFLCVQKTMHVEIAQNQKMCQLVPPRDQIHE